jgi:FKBP-type peptidyl-prolyl cis-trans isomerase FklB
MKYALTSVLIAGLLFGVCFAGETVELKDENARVNYSVGFQIGGDFKRQGVDVNPEALVKGIEDALSGAEPLLTQQEMRETLVNLKKRIIAAQRAQKRQNSEKYRGEGREFLAENAKKEGVKTTPSGLQYKVIREGTGKTPGPHDSVTVHYRGTLLDGREFDSSYRKNEPATFRVDGVISGWTEALQLMKEGAKWQLFIPADLAYGERGPLADKTLIFEVELISVN